MSLIPNTLVHCTDGKTLVIESGGTLNAKAGSTVNLPAGGVTLANISFTGKKSLAADGRNGAGAITLTGAAVGDRVFQVIGQAKAEASANSFLGSSEANFESVITVVDQIQQSSASNLTANTYLFILLPAAAAE